MRLGARGREGGEGEEWYVNDLEKHLLDFISKSKVGKFLVKKFKFENLKKSKKIYLINQLQT